MSQSDACHMAVEIKLFLGSSRTQREPRHLGSVLLQCRCLEMTSPEMTSPEMTSPEMTSPRDDRNEDARPTKYAIKRKISGSESPVTKQCWESEVESVKLLMLLNCPTVRAQLAKVDQNLTRRGTLWAIANQ
ncbi:uncharacterized protein LY89DRAFT_474363 [Mollisia scopiformis]|uniref:Uncharacterized protein n=1 Tax=Mollisia scopiformis TaxID=149040 RepID=A0A194XJ76_MOLSC|nr:uncharacterized protein LY89DRAFT_474363 [Mollisia scopiformis]KUJ20213.1 hypothetical protein LY89DRAFT_474363 [Mollisia scopiformis]